MAATTGQLGLVTPTQGTLSGTWGDTVNNGITEYVNIAIAGTLSFAGDGAITLANTTGTASATNIGSTTAQYMVIRITGTLTTTKVITGPSYSKIYLVDNAATGGSVTFKASGQTGVTIAVGERTFVYFNGTDYVKASENIVNLATGVTGILPVANGGNGTATPTLTQGANITITGSWPNYTIAAANPGTGTVTGVTASPPLASSGGAAPNISFTGTLPIANGGTGNTSGAATLLQTANFSISEVGGVLVFKYGSTTIASMTSAGVFTTLSDITGNGTP